ncbi:MAG: hypothetical protein M1546_05095, partial [Chloroflexi bacterium]|nr:hypothetical protein [Chloroflexota bacterium]
MQRDKPAEATQTLEAVLPSHCPACGGPVVEDRVEDWVEAQYQVDLPRPVPVVVTQFNVHVGHCQTCQQRVQGRHAEQTSDALGAAGVQIGPNTIGLGMELKHGRVVWQSRTRLEHLECVDDQPLDLGARRRASGAEADADLPTVARAPAGQRRGVWRRDGLDDQRRSR